MFRADVTVQLNEEGRRAFPNESGLLGIVEGYNEPFLARVLWDGRKTTVLLHVSYLEAMEGSLEGRHGQQSRAQRNQQILENRKLIRRAFDLIRYDPAEKHLVSSFARALGGKSLVTDALLNAARQTIARRAPGETTVQKLEMSNG